MKKLKRLPVPPCFDNVISKNKKLGFYKKLRIAKTNEINPRWNNVCKDTDDISFVRKKLLEMSDNACAFCGMKIKDETFDVEHFLPKNDFPYLAYCFENYLPSCKTCNQPHKSTFVPNSLKGKDIIEDILKGIFPNMEIYDHATLLQNTTDRIIEPTFDNPEEHLTFVPEFFIYESKTNIGKITNTIFFAHKEVAEKWENLSNVIKNIVLDSTNPINTINALILFSGYEYICKHFLDYWTKEKEEGRLR